MGNPSKRVGPKYDATVRDCIVRHHLNPDLRESFVLLAGLLEEGSVNCPLELQGDAVSDNGRCEWDKKKAFINLHKHGISFDVVSLLYSPVPPSGYEVLFSDPDGSGAGGESVWGLDVRDFVVAKIGRKGCVLIQVSPDNTLSGRVRLISARPVSQRVAMEVIQEREIKSSVEIFDQIFLQAIFSSHRRR